MPILVCGTIIYVYPRIPLNLPKLGPLWVFPAGGLTVFVIGCIFYVIDWLLRTDRNAFWFLKAALAMIAMTADIFLLMCAIGAIGR